MRRFIGRLAEAILNTSRIVWELMCIVGGCIVTAFCLLYDFLRVCLTGRFSCYYIRPIASALRVSWGRSSIAGELTRLSLALRLSWSELRRLTSWQMETLRGCWSACRLRRGALSWLLLSSLGTAWLYYFMPQPGPLAEAGVLSRAVFRADNYALLVMLFAVATRR